MYWLWEFEGVRTFDHKENEKNIYENEIGYHESNT